MSNYKTHTEMKTSKFEIGKNYEMHFITDSDLKPSFTCIHRTAKTVRFQRTGKKEILNRRIKIYDGCEYVLEGSYSMAPSINADREIK